MPSGFECRHATLANRAPYLGIPALAACLGASAIGARLLAADLHSSVTSRDSRLIQPAMDSR